MKKIFVVFISTLFLSACSNATPVEGNLSNRVSVDDEIIASPSDAVLQPVALKKSKTISDKDLTVAGAKNCGFPPNQDNRGKSFTQLAKEVSDYAASIGKTFAGTVKQLNYAATPEASEEFKTALAKCAGMVK